MLGIRRRGQRLLDGPLITFFNLAAYGVFTPSLFVLLRQYVVKVTVVHNNYSINSISAKAVTGGPPFSGFFLYLSQCTHFLLLVIPVL